MDDCNRIQFAHPDLPRLTEHYTVVDLHFHSIYSDGRDRVEAIADQAAALGIGVALTDHNAIEGAVAISAFKDILTIPGIEVTSQEGAHILLYFYDIDTLALFFEKEIAPYRGRDVMCPVARSPETLIRRAGHYGAVVIFPHPCCGFYTGIANPQTDPRRLEKLLNMAHGVEVINSENLNKWNLKCALLGFNLNKAVSGGSDGHALYQLGKVVSYADCPPRCADFLNALKKKQIKVVGKEIDILRKVRSNGHKLRTSLKHAPDIVEKNINYSYKVINIKSRSLTNRVRNSINEKMRRSAKHS